MNFEKPVEIKRFSRLFFQVALSVQMNEVYLYLLKITIINVWMNMENQENNNGQLQIELKEEVAQGTYANLAIITHSSSEFILDFVRVMPGMPKAGVKSRIVLAPEHAKRLLRALEENIGKYERSFGPIRMPDEQPLPPLPNIKGEA